MTGRENDETPLGFGCWWSLNPGCAARPWALFFNRFAVPVRLGVGTEWLLDGRAWRVVRQLAPDRFVAQDTKFRTEQEFSQEELLAHYAAARLRFAADDSATSDHKSPTSKTAPLEHLSTKERRTLQRRWSALEPLLRSKRWLGRESASVSTREHRPTRTSRAVTGKVGRVGGYAVWL